MANLTTLLFPVSAAVTNIPNPISAIVTNVPAVSTVRAPTLESRLDTTNNRLQTLINQAVPILAYTTNISDYVSPYTYASQTTQNLANNFNLSYVRIFNIFGTSFAGYDQYLQIYNEDSGDLFFSQIIKANSNFNFSFPNGIGGDVPMYIRNSLTPLTYTPGNEDLTFTVTYYPY